MKKSLGILFTAMIGLSANNAFAAGHTISTQTEASPRNQSQPQAKSKVHATMPTINTTWTLSYETLYHCTAHTLAAQNKTKKHVVLTPPLFYAGPCDFTGTPDLEAEKDMLDLFFNTTGSLSNIESLDMRYFHVKGTLAWEKAIAKMPNLKALIVNDVVFAGLSHPGSISADAGIEQAHFHDNLKIHVHLESGKTKPRWSQAFLNQFNDDQIVIHKEATFEFPSFSISPTYAAAACAISYCIGFASSSSCSRY